MSNPAIAAYAAKATEYNDAIDKSIDGLSADIEQLNAKIAELQATPPVLDAGDQALLDDLQARGTAIADKIAALDAKTEQPPVVPVEPV